MLYSWREAMKVLHIGISGIVLVSLIGCSSVGLGSKRVDYRSGAAQVPSLEVPPDLTVPGSDERYRVPQGDGGNVATFSDYSKGGAVAEQGRSASAILPEVKGVRLERNGTQRWLVVNDKPENVWFVVKAFLQENGLTIKSEDQAAFVTGLARFSTASTLPASAISTVCAWSTARMARAPRFTSPIAAWKKCCLPIRILRSGKRAPMTRRWRRSCCNT